MSILLFIAQLIRANVRWVQNLFLPTAVIAGFIGLFFGRSFLTQISGELAVFALPFSDEIASYAYMLVVVLFASLYLGNRQSQSPRAMMRQVGDTFTTNMAAEIGGFGIALLVGGALLIVFVPDISSSFAILQPAGFIGGHGYAAAIGVVADRLALRQRVEGRDHAARGSPAGGPAPLRDPRSRTRAPRAHRPAAARAVHTGRVWIYL